MILAMQEILSRTNDPKAPLRDQEFYGLELCESVASGETAYCVREARVQWDDSVKDMVWDEPEIEAFVTLHEAKERYAARRQALAEKGFTYSDMDLF
jgi:hypothetical protein